MGFQNGMVVMEIGYDDDSDEDVRDGCRGATGEEMVDEDSDEVVDAILLWYREATATSSTSWSMRLRPLADDGFIWLLTPKRGRHGYVEPSDIAEAAPVAGLSQTSITTVGTDWSARPAGRRASRRERDER